MRDPRIDEYARLLVERSVGVKAGWEVLIRSTPLARPLIDAVSERIARIGAFPLLQLAWEPTSGPFAREAPLDVLRVPSPAMAFIWENCDAVIMISAPENTREGADLSEVVLSPLLYLGAAMLYVDQAARLRSRSNAGLHPPLDPEPAGRPDPQVES